MDQYIEIFAFLFATIGPIKVSVAFAEVTARIPPGLRWMMAFRIVSLAMVLGVILTLTGKILVDLFHFSLPALEVAGGMLLFVYATKIVLFDSEPLYGGEELTESAAKQLALFPLTLPILISPAAIVALLTLSVAYYHSVMDLVFIVVTLFGLMLINLLALVLAGKLATIINPVAWQISERVVGVLIAAFGVETALTGLAAFGIGVTVPH